MADRPDLDLPELEEKPGGFPWIGMGIILVVVALAAGWILWGKSAQVGQAASAAEIERQLTADKVVLQNERDKVFDLTEQVDALKQALQMGLSADREKTVADYNKAAAAQRAQREKVKKLADLYNEKVAKLHQLQ